MTFVYERGEEINVGSHGEHSYVFAGGEEVTDTGVSTFAFESGTGLGGTTLTFEGQEVAFFESNELVSSWYDYNQGPEPEAVGLDGIGMDSDPSSPAMYIFGFHDTQNDLYSIGGWFIYQGQADTVYGNNITWVNLGGGATSPSSPQVQDDPDANENANGYSTDGNGDPVSDNIWDSDIGDGVAYTVDSGSYTIEATLAEVQGGTAPLPDKWVGRDPNGATVTKSATSGSTFTIEMSV